MAASRQAFGMARAGAIPVRLAALSSARGTPTLAIIFVSVMAGLFSFAGDIGAVAQMSNAAVLIAFVLVNASLIWIAKTQPVDADSRIASRIAIAGFGIVPVLGLITSVVMLAYTGTIPVLLGIALVASGILVRVLMEHTHQTAAETPAESGD
jgi:APA family basic amino acid/polyamine antiporter